MSGRARRSLISRSNVPRNSGAVIVLTLTAGLYVVSCQGPDEYLRDAGLHTGAAGAFGMAGTFGAGGTANGGTTGAAGGPVGVAGSAVGSAGTTGTGGTGNPVGAAGTTGSRSGDLSRGSDTPCEHFPGERFRSRIRVGVGSSRHQGHERYLESENRFQISDTDSRRFR